MHGLFRLFFATPRRTLGWIAAGLASVFGFGMYLQYGTGLTPCPMCIVQRYAVVAVMLIALLGAWLASRKAHAVSYALILLVSVGGAFVAARQSWLQWFPPEVATCGRDFYGMIEQMPLSRAIPQIFAGSGDCTKVDWTFLGGTLANWSFVCFVGLALTGIGWLIALAKKPPHRHNGLFPMP